MQPRVITTDDEIDAAIAQAKVYEQYRPKAIAAIYRAKDDVIAIKLATGVELVIPRKLMQGLENADPRAVAKIEIWGHGSSLHWDALDVDHYIPGLIDGVFGTRKWMAAIGAVGGAARTDAKVRAARKNGRKGGRPRKRATA
ncbi:MAG: DUF2442 domain-containing protein [Vulcanimicrobiaceae bacterium]